MKKLFLYFFLYCLIGVLWFYLEIHTPIAPLIRIFIVAAPFVLLSIWVVIDCARDLVFRGVMNRTLLVALRLAIGWLFLVEGIEKFESHRTGPTTTSKPWSAAGYLRESSGPLKPFFEWQLGGNADNLALEVLTVRELEPNEDSMTTIYKQRVSPRLKSDWETYVKRFTEHYQFDDKQRELAQAKLDQSLEAAGAWILGLGRKKDEKTGKEWIETVLMEVERTGDFPGAPPYKKKGPPAEFIKEYRAKVDECREVENQQLPAFGRDVAKEKLRGLKANVAKLRTELLTALKKPLEDGLQDLLTMKGFLTKEQKELPELDPNPPPADLPTMNAWSDLISWNYWKGFFHDIFQWDMRQWVDFFVRWGVLLIGVGLWLGLFTRLSCLAGAMFLLFLHAAIPMFPWLPEVTKAEGHYMFVSRNLIMALALLVLATTYSGRWFGLDGLLQFLNPWRRRSTPAVEPESIVEKRLASTFNR